MKIKLKILMIIFLIVVSSCATAVHEKRTTRYDIKPSQTKAPLRIAIIGFDVLAETYGVKRIGNKTEEMLNTAFLKTGYFDVVDRKYIKNILVEQKFQASGMIDQTTAVKLGKILGAQAIITGAVTEIGFSAASFIVNIPSCRASIDVRVIDVETGKVIAAETGEGRSSTTVGGDVKSALGKKDAELWIGEALRKASEDISQKITAYFR